MMLFTIAAMLFPTDVSAKTFDWIGEQIRRVVTMCTPGLSPTCFTLHFVRKGYPTAIILHAINGSPVGTTLRVVGNVSLNDILRDGASSIRTRPGDCKEKDFVLGWGLSRSIPVIGVRVIATIFKACGPPPSA